MLLEGICRTESLGEVVPLLEDMFEKGICLDVVAYSVLLNGFCKAGMLISAMEILCRMYKFGVFPNDVVYSTLIYNFCKQQHVLKAMRVYSMMHKTGHSPDVFICNSLISSLCTGGRIREAEDFMRHMHKIGLVPDSVAFHSVIDCYANVGEGLKALSWFDKMANLGRQPSVYTYASLRKGICRGGNLTEALGLFNRLRGICCATDVVVVYNSLLAEICKLGHFHMALILIDEMVQNNVLPDSHTYTSLLAGLCGNDKLVAAILLLERALSRGAPSSNRVMYTFIVDGLFKSGLPKIAGYFFDEMIRKSLSPDTVALNVVMDGYSKHGQMDKVSSFFSSMREPSLTTYNILLRSYSRRKNISECSKLYQSLREKGFTPDKVTSHYVTLGLCVSPDGDTYNSIFKGLKRTLDFQNSHRLLHIMIEEGFTPIDRQYCNLITSMCKVGYVKGAFKLKDEMELLGISSSRTIAEGSIIRGLVRRGKMEEAMLVLECMLRVHLLPTVATFTTVMHGLCKSCKLCEALKLKTTMELHGAKPDVIAYNVLITGLCAGGHIDDAYHLYEELKERGMCPTITTFTVLLNAFCSAGNDHLAKGESLLNDLQERGLADELHSNTQALCERLTIVKEKLNALRKKKKKRR
ncbi:hypothetical protein CQW23_09717 [Capsicum baccatum]|uniref:Pentatricopeptide repeat-containing protein n=1 Tax=Capsicum baccatum TaxID=33114 RepID=A0A2G2WXP9_CAPBA|nr:hypothetical protein CQW23_09717 [Capsicum baccatum]